MNLTNIKLDVDYLCGSTSATYTDTNKVRNINIAYQDTSRLIWESADGWQYSDSNSTTLDIAYATIVASQKDYSLPSTAQRLERVEVKGADGNWSLLKQIDPTEIDIAMPEHLKGTGLPLKYDIVGRSLMLYPTPSSTSVTLASGLAVYVNSEVTEFPVTATSTTPGFATPFHRILSYAAAIDFVQDPTQKQLLAAQRDRLEKGLVRFYSKRNPQKPAMISPRTKKAWRQYQ